MHKFYGNVCANRILKIDPNNPYIKYYWEIKIIKLNWVAFGVTSSLDIKFLKGNHQWLGIKKGKLPKMEIIRQDNLDYLIALKY